MTIRPFAAAGAVAVAASVVAAVWLARTMIDTLSRVLVHPEARP